MGLSPDEQLVKGTGFSARKREPGSIFEDEIRLYWEEEVPALHLPSGKQRKAFGVSIPCNPKPLKPGGMSLFELLQERKERLIELIRSERGINDRRVTLTTLKMIREYRAEGLDADQV